MTTLRFTKKHKKLSKMWITVRWPRLPQHDEKVERQAAWAPWAFRTPPCWCIDPAQFAQAMPTDYLRRQLQVLTRWENLTLPG